MDATTVAVAGLDLERVREDVSHLHDLTTREALTDKHTAVMGELKRILDGVRNEFDDFQGR
jgi:hypothetical protein